MREALLMKPFGPVSSRFGFLRAVFISTLLNFVAEIFPASAAEVTDPTLNLAIHITNQNVILSWGGANAVPYQLESSSDLYSWSAIGPALNGTGATLSVTNPIAAQELAFYRVR